MAASTVKLNPAKGRANANAALGLGSSVFRDCRRVLRNCSGTIPFYDPQYLKSLGSRLFEGAPWMSGIFIPVLSSEDWPVSGFGDLKIEHPFHVLDCGLCLFLAQSTNSGLSYKLYRHAEFVRVHDNLRHLLTVRQGTSKDVLSSLASYRMCSSDNHSYWVVQRIVGYEHAAVFGQVKATTISNVNCEETVCTVVGSAAGQESSLPNYDVESPSYVPSSPELPPKKRSKNRGSSSGCSTPTEPSCEVKDSRFSKRVIVPLPDVFADSD